MSESINARVNRLADGIDRQELQFLLASILTDLEALKTSHNQLLTDYNVHVHGGVTAGAANTSNVADSTAVAVTLNTTA